MSLQMGLSLVLHVYAGVMSRLSRRSNPFLQLVFDKHTGPYSLELERSLVLHISPHFMFVAVDFVHVRAYAML